MKTKYFTFALFLSVLALAGCQKDEVSATGGELRLAPQIGDMTTVATRAAGDSFFEVGQAVDVSILKSNASSAVLYQYVYNNDGIFYGSPAFRFDMNDNYIKQLTATWPSSAVRQAGINPDQRTQEAFREADWMIATAEANGIMPTDKAVPLEFTRENCMVEFELVGQNGRDVDILELTIELQVDGVATAFRAYCDPDTGHAQIIVSPDTKVVAEDRYMIGTLRASPDTRYTMIFPETDLTLKEGYRYLVTLTPRGYNMSVYPVIEGFSDADQNGIGIPFQQPDPMPDGSFLVDTPLRLITMSYLMRHYTDGTTFDWPSRTYIIPSELTLTQAMANRYTVIPADLFTGSMVDENGTAVTTVHIDGGEELTLVEPEVVTP